MNHVISKHILKVFLVVLLDNLFEEVVGIPVMEPGTAPNLLIPSVA